MLEGAIGCQRRVGIEDVEVGMFLEDVYNQQGILLLSANVAVTSPEQIVAFKHQGVSSVYINTEKGKDVRRLPGQSAAENEIPVREREYYKELVRAKEVHRNTVERAREVLSSVRLGKSFSTEGIERSAEGMVESILRNPDALVSLAQIKGYDEYTYTHSVNVGILITSLAQGMGYDRDHLLMAGVGGILHDIGKMRVPERILNKPGKYTESEFAVMKKHPEQGLEIVKDRKQISDVSRTVIIEHHERYNGTGYPHGIGGDKIQEIGLIAAVADVYDAMTTDRIYRAAWPPQRALAMIFQGCDQDYSRRIVELFTRHLGIYPVGSFVKLHSGEMGVVVRIEKGTLLAPDVLVLFAENGKRLKEPVEYKLTAKQKEENGQKYKIQVSLNPKALNVDISKYIQGKLFD